MKHRVCGDAEHFEPDIFYTVYRQQEHSVLLTFSNYCIIITTQFSDLDPAGIFFFPLDYFSKSLADSSYNVSQRPVCLLKLS